MKNRVRGLERQAEYRKMLFGRGGGHDIGTSERTASGTCAMVGRN